MKIRSYVLYDDIDKDISFLTFEILDFLNKQFKEKKTSNVFDPFLSLFINYINFDTILKAQ